MLVAPGHTSGTIILYPVCPVFLCARSIKVAKKLRLDGIVVIGEGDSNTNAAMLGEYFQRVGSVARRKGEGAELGQSDQTAANMSTLHFARLRVYLYPIVCKSWQDGMSSTSLRISIQDSRGVESRRGSESSPSELMRVCLLGRRWLCRFVALSPRYIGIIQLGLGCSHV